MGSLPSFAPKWLVLRVTAAFSLARPAFSLVMKVFSRGIAWLKLAFLVKIFSYLLLFWVGEYSIVQVAARLLSWQPWLT